MSLLQAGARRGPALASLPLRQPPSQQLGTEVSLMQTGTVPIILEVDSSTLKFAGSETGAAVSFEVDGSWTPEGLLCKPCYTGYPVRRSVNLTAWPTQLKLRALGADAWGYSQIVLQWGQLEVTVLDVKTGNSSQGVGTNHWVESNGTAPEVNTYDVPQVRWTSSFTPEKWGKNCTTRYDSRAVASGYVTSVPGTPCVFGTDPQDEGSHCILDRAQYGSFGWCYTSLDLSSWGSCGEDCPLYGADRVLQKEILEVAKAFRSMVPAASK